MMGCLVTNKRSSWGPFVHTIACAKEFWRQGREALFALFSLLLALFSQGQTNGGGGVLFPANPDCSQVALE